MAEFRQPASFVLPGTEFRGYSFDTLDSTSDECRRRLAAGETRFFVIAKTQTGGRGRIGRSFFSPDGGLYLSLAMPMAPDPVGLTCFAAVTAADAIEKICGISCGIKWVNDLYLVGRKVAGILAESVGNSVILGIGINLRPTALPAELEQKVGFLDCDESLRLPLAAEMVQRLPAFSPGNRDFMDEYRRRSVILGRRIRCTVGERTFSAAALAIDDEGGLLVSGPEGPETLHWGEVSLQGEFL